MIPCTGPPEDFPDGDVVSECSPDGAGHAYIVQERLWKGRQVLRVFFMNPEVLEGWKCGRKKMTTEMIMEWVGVWQQASSAPQFTVTTNDTKADIRVKFSGNLKLTVRAIV